MMSAGALLDEIHSESLQTLLSAVAFETSPPGCTQIDALDAHFFAAGQRHPSSRSSLNRGDLIEIQGPTMSGKTHLLYRLLITCLMPSNHTSVNFEGWNKTALVFDTDGTFDVNRLHRLLISRLCYMAVKSGILLPEQQLAEIGTQSLEKLHIFRVTSSTQLSASLLHLDTFHATHLPNAEIGLLAVDSISSFYWPDRFTVEQMRSAPPSTGDPHDFANPNPLHHVLTALQRFRISHGPVVVLTNWGLNVVPQSSFYKQHLHPFPVLLTTDDASEITKREGTSGLSPLADENSHTLPPLTHHITLPLVPVTQLQPNMCEGTTSAEEEMRKTEMLQKCQVVGIVRTAGSSRVGRFSFQIREAEILTGEESGPIAVMP